MIKTGSRPTYLHATGRIRSLETSLLTKERLRRILDAETITDALRVLSECGIDMPNYDFSTYTPSKALYKLSELLSEVRANLYDFVATLSESTDLVSFFRVPIDCHNIKSLVKESKSSHTAMLLNGGTYSPAKLREFLQNEGKDLSEHWSAAYKNACDILDETNDAQKSDFVLDQAQLFVSDSYARTSKSDYLVSYSNLLADIANLKSAVRLSKIRNGVQLAPLTLVELGSIPSTSILSAMKSQNLDSLYEGTDFEPALTASSKNTLTDFELELSALRRRFFENINFIPFGPEILISYIATREEEFSKIRIAIAGKLSSTPIDIIEHRLGLS